MLHWTYYPTLNKDWWKRYQAAATALEERDEKVDAIFEEIETDMTLLGEQT